MSMENDNHLAVCHVLGLLEPEDEKRALGRIADDDAFARLAALWAERFDAVDVAGDEDVPEDLWARIDRSVSDAEAAPGTHTIRSKGGVWEKIGAGIERRLVFVDRTEGTQSYYVRMDKGATLPLHAHTRPEQCVLIKGQLLIGDEVFTEGDFQIGMAGEKHLPMTATTDTLIFIYGEI